MELDEETSVKEVSASNIQTDAPAQSLLSVCELVTISAFAGLPLIISINSHPKDAWFHKKLNRPFLNSAPHLVLSSKETKSNQLKKAVGELTKHSEELHQACDNWIEVFSGKALSKLVTDRANQIASDTPNS